MSVEIGFYVPSYRRYSSTTTHKLIPQSTYVVRETERAAYLAAGVPNVLGVEDSLINSFEKVNNWIIENAPEQMLCVMDDDIDQFCYRIGLDVRLIDDPSVAVEEIERILQVMYDLDIGYGGLSQTASPYTFNKEIAFVGICGPVRFVNRERVKSRYQKMKYFTDIDFVLNELRENRIVFRPNYFVGKAGVETNEGGNNTERTTRDRYETYENIMKPKWGPYFVYNKKRNTPLMQVPR